MGWKSRHEMSFVERKMFWAACEAAMLHELPVAEHNYLPDGVEVVPAHDPEACSQVLLDWFDAGLVTVSTSFPPETELEAAEARDLLADPSRWTPAHALVLTDLGDSFLPD